MHELMNVSLQINGRQILQDTQLQLTPGKIHVLMGPSGCGKSTILRVLAGLLKPDSGKTLGANSSESFVFQEPRLLGWLNVSENVALPIRLRGPANSIQSSDISQWLHNVGLGEAALLYPHQLSGGMKMRAAIARALISRPQLLLMDEPFAALDEVQRWHLQDLLKSLQKQNPMTILFVTHSLAEATYLADVVHMMAPKGGRILKSVESSLQGTLVRDSEAEQALLKDWSRLYRGLISGIGG